MSFIVTFVGKSCLIANTAFQQTDPTHWVLDVTSLVSPADYRALKEVCLALVEPNSLPPDAALALYVAIDGQHWIFRGFVSNEHPSDVMPLSWPEEDASMQAMPRHAVIGISIEPLAEAAAKHGAKIGAKEDFCKRVGMDLFQYMQSYGGVSSVGTDQLLVPANVLDKWFTRISSRLKNDPDFLTRQKDIV